MRALVFASSFKRSFKALVREKKGIELKITVEYDCRIVFNFAKNPVSGEEEIFLIDVGTHDDVY